MSSKQSKSLSYRDAGVNIDAGNAFVEKIKTSVASTNRPGVMGSLGGFGGMFELPTDRYKQPVLVSVGLLIIATIWDFINGRKSTVCTTKEFKPDTKPVDLSRRAVNGAALSVAAAGAFYGMYKSVEIYAPKTEVGDIACYGVNSCKGTTACSSANNACTGQNSCKGKGWINLSATECKSRGGQTLKGSPADPAA